MINRNELTEYQKGRFDALCELEAHLQVNIQKLQENIDNNEDDIINKFAGRKVACIANLNKVLELKDKVNGSTSEIGTRMVQ